eukprot:TRINITY_DN7652_c0_g1::TRINITY_DN7652_c0_g1_i1::g.18525::m.18525 TRINITY_DN7652_c0_g1::TRINITY_DN7652_c0_g1_i1::g.18525  ORF type:complete len:164 (+),score=9.23 TRINITY_DN7652_c0_g1_i1:38-493(+)
MPFLAQMNPAATILPSHLPNGFPSTTSELYLSYPSQDVSATTGNLPLLSPDMTLAPAGTDHSFDPQGGINSLAAELPPASPTAFTPSECSLPSSMGCSSPQSLLSSRDAQESPVMDSPPLDHARMVLAEVDDEDPCKALLNDKIVDLGAPF